MEVALQYHQFMPSLIQFFGRRTPQSRSQVGLVYSKVAADYHSGFQKGKIQP